MAACAYGTSECNPTAEFVDCAGCFVGNAETCSAAPALVATTLLNRPTGSGGSADCHSSSDLARLEEWVRTHPSSSHMQELTAEARN